MVCQEHLMGWGWMVKNSPGMSGTMGSIPSTTKKERNTSESIDTVLILKWLKLWTLVISHFFFLWPDDSNLLLNFIYTLWRLIWITLFWTMDQLFSLLFQVPPLTFLNSFHSQFTILINDIWLVHIELCLNTYGCCVNSLTFCCQVSHLRVSEKSAHKITLLLLLIIKETMKSI